MKGEAAWKRGLQVDLECRVEGRGKGTLGNGKSQDVEMRVTGELTHRERVFGGTERSPVLGSF